MKNVYFILLLLFGISVSAQNQTKRHFIIHSKFPDIDLTKYETALNQTSNLEAFRFIEKSRTIFFTDKLAWVELLSANELLEKYNKPIHLQNISINSKHHNIEFAISLDGKSVKAQSTN